MKIISLLIAIIALLSCTQGVRNPEEITKLKKRDVNVVMHELKLVPIEKYDPNKNYKKLQFWLMPTGRAICVNGFIRKVTIIDSRIPDYNSIELAFDQRLEKLIEELKTDSEDEEIHWVMTIDDGKKGFIVSGFDKVKAESNDLQLVMLKELGLTADIKR